MAQRKISPPSSKSPSVRRPTAAPAAAAPPSDALRRGMPIPAGTHLGMQVKGVIDGGTKLTPAERDMLVRAGWDGQSAIPSNFFELHEVAKESAMSSADLDDLTPPVSLDTPALEVDEIDVDSLPPQQRQEYLDMMAEMFAEANAIRQEAKEVANLPEGMSPSVREAVVAARRAPSIPVTDDLGSNVYATGQAKSFTAPPAPTPVDPPTAETKENKPAPESVTPKICNRCHHPVDAPAVEVTERDKELYIDSVCSSVPMRKTYWVLRKTLGVTVRALQVEEWDLIWRQLHNDEMRGRILTSVDKLEWLSRYRMVLQIVSLDGRIQLTCPSSIDDWDITLTDEEVRHGDTKVRSVYRWFIQNVILTDTTQRLLQMQVGDFNNMIQQIERMAVDGNF